MEQTPPIVTTHQRAFASDYMNWAKTRSRARYNLATSGVPGYPLLAHTDVKLEDLEINSPGGRYGYLPLLEAIGREYQVPIDNIAAGGGTSGANEYTMLLLLGPGDEALIETPAYDVLPQLARFTGATVKQFHRRPENQWAPDPDEIKRLLTPATKLVVLTNLHNPTSAWMSQGEIATIAKLAAEVGAHVLVDEVYLDAVWDPNRPPSAFHAADNVIVTSSLTKVYGLSGLRCGWIFAPKDVAERLWGLIDLFDNIPAHIAEQLSAKAFGQLDEIRRYSRQLIETNRAIYREFAEPRGWDVPQYGTVAFPQVQLDLDRLRHEYETTVVPGHFFDMPDRVRISLVTDPGTLRAGLERIQAASAAA